MVVRTSVVALTSVCVLAAAAACESGGADGSSTSSSGSLSSSSGSTSSGGSSGLASSSGGSSSGEAQCGATCQSQATLTFDEDNADARLDGVIVEACFRDRCARGSLTPPDGGSAYTLELASTDDASTLTVYASVTASPSAAGSLRFRIQWPLAYSGPDAPVNGDLYTVSGRRGDLEFFSHDFTATYNDIEVCGTRCKQFTSSP